MLSIILPHLSTSEPTELCKHYLQKNTVNEYELIEVVDWTDVYAAYNYGADQAKYDHIIMMNDDMFVAPGWDINFIKYLKPKTFVTMWLVEPGFVPVNSRMLEYNCGSTVETFDYEKFLSYIDTVNVPEATKGGLGAWMPMGFHKSTWIPYPNKVKNYLEHPSDIELTDVILPSLGYTPIKVKSFAYHLQCYSHR